MEKARLSPKTSTPAKISQFETEILEAEQKSVATRKEFGDVTKVLKAELESFEEERVRDLSESMKSYLESVVGCQRKVVSVWEEFLKSLVSELELLNKEVNDAIKADYINFQ